MKPGTGIFPTGLLPDGPSGIRVSKGEGGVQDSIRHPFGSTGINPMGREPSGRGIYRNLWLSFCISNIVNET